MTEEIPTTMESLFAEWRKQAKAKQEQHQAIVESPAYQSPGNAGVLVSPAVVSRFADLQGLQHGRQVLAGIQHGIGISQFPDDLLGAVPLSSFRHRVSS